MSYNTVVSTEFKLVGVEAYIAGITSAAKATDAINGKTAKLSIDDGDAKAKVAGVSDETKKLAAQRINPKVQVDTGDSKAQLAGVSQEIEKLRNIGWLSGELAAIGYGLLKIAQPAAAVQQNLRDIQVLSGATSAEIDKLGSSARTFTDIGVGAGAATAAMVELSRAGVATADTARVSRDALALSVAGQIDAATAANTLTNTLHAFNLTMDQSGRVSNLYAGAANASSATTQDLISAMAQGGQAASSMGQSLEDTLAVFAAFSDRGLKGSDAGTSFRTMMLRLIPTSAQARDAMQQLGLQFQDAGGKILPITDIAEQLRQKLSGLSEAERTHALQVIFGTDAFRAANILYQQGAAGLDKYRSALGQTTAEQVATERTKTLQGSMQKLNAEWENTRVVLGNALLPAFTAGVSGLAGISRAIAAMPAPVVELTADLLALASAAKAIAVVGQIGSVLTGLSGKGAAASAATTAAKVAVPIEVEASEIVATGMAAKVAAWSAGAASSIGAAIGTIVIPVAVSIIASKVIFDWAESRAVKKAQSEAASDPVYQQALALSDQTRQMSDEELKKNQDIIVTDFQASVDEARRRLAAYVKNRPGIVSAAAEHGIADPVEERLKAVVAEIQYLQAHEAGLFDSKFGATSKTADSLVPDTGEAAAKASQDMERIKAAAQDAQGSLTEFGKAADASMQALEKIDPSKGLAGITKVLPDLKSAQATLAAFHVDNANLDNLVRMGDAVGNLDAQLRQASGAFNGFSAQFDATQGSISFLDDFQKKAKEAADAAREVPAAFRTNDQTELLKQYPAILDNTNAMIQKLRANQAGDILGMAKNLPNLIEYDKRLRALVQQYGGPAGLQIELQLEVNEGLAKQKVDALIAGITGTGPLAATIDVAVKGNDDAEAALNKLRGVVNGIPTQKEIKALASVVGIGNIEELSLLINGLHDKSVTIHTATVNTSSGSTVPVQGPTGGGGTIGAYASGTSGAPPGWAWVGDRPGDYSHAELVHFSGGEQVLSNAASMRAAGGGGMPGFYYGTSMRGLMGLPGFYEPTEPASGEPVGTIDVTKPGAVRGMYGGPGTGVAPVSPAAVNAGTAAVQKQTAAVQQEADKLIDASAAAQRLNAIIAGLDSSGVQKVNSEFQAMNGYLQKAAQNATVKTGNSDADTAAQLAATKQAAQGAVEYAVAFGQALADARDPSKDLSADFDKIRATGGPLAENAVRWLSVQREINVSMGKIADLQETIKKAEREHTERAEETAQAINDQQKSLQAEQAAEAAAQQTRDRGHTREQWANQAATTSAQRKYDADTRARQAYEQGLQRQWAAESTQAQNTKATRDRQFTEDERRRKDATTADNAAWTVEQRQFDDRRTALERYGTDRAKQLATEKTALDELHKAQVGQLGAQEQLLSAAVAGSNDSASRIMLSAQLAATKEIHQSIDDIYQQALDANQAAADAEKERAATALANLQDEQTKEQRAHEDRLARLATEEETASRIHDDAESKIASEQTLRDQQHAAFLQNLQDEDTKRDESHARQLERDADKAASDEHAYQEETWRIQDENAKRQKGYTDEIARLQDEQAKADALFKKTQTANQDALDSENKRLAALQEQQGYLDSVRQLWQSVYDVAGASANVILAALSGVAPAGTVTGTVTGKGAQAGRRLGAADGATGITGAFTAGERGTEQIFATEPVTVVPHYRMIADQAAASSASSTSVGQVGPFVMQGGMSYEQYETLVVQALRQFWQEHGPEGALNMLGVR